MLPPLCSIIADILTILYTNFFFTKLFYTQRLLVVESNVKKNQILCIGGTLGDKY